MDIYTTPNIECPYCSHDFNIADDGGDMEWVQVCPSCHREMEIMVEISNDYYVSKISSEPTNSIKEVGE